MCKVTHKFLLSSVLVILFLCYAFTHPFYLGISELSYETQKSRLEGSVKLFTGDLEDALGKTYQRKIDLIHPSDTLACRNMLEAYLLKHYRIQVNGKKISYKCIGFESDKEAIWMFIESETCSKPIQLNLTNTLLYENFKEQTHIAHIEVGTQSKSFKIVNPESEMTFEF